MTDLKSKTAMVVDNGLFVSLAVRLGQDFGKVYYCCPSWMDAFPNLNKVMIGHGFDGIEVVDTLYGEHYDDIDIWIFPDVYFGEFQTHLADEGKLVWGSRMGAELELHREAMKLLMKELNLPVGPWTKITGLTALRKFLKENQNQWVKINKFRGITETFLSRDYKSIEPKLDELGYSLGLFKDMLNFIVEEALDDRVEVGIDAYTIDGQFPKRLLSGIEVKDMAYVGIFKDYAALPKVMTDFDRALTPTLKAYGYRGFYSAELRIGKDHIPYMIDFCARVGSPPNELYQEFYKNISQIVWDGANGICTDPIPESKYGVQQIIYSEFADTNWQSIDIPPELERYVKLHNSVKIDGRYYVVPQPIRLTEIGSVIGWGKTVKEAMDMCQEVFNGIYGPYLQTHEEAFTEAEKEIAKLKKFNINLF
jgi:hypothetical protein